MQVASTKPIATIFQPFRLIAASSCLITSPAYIGGQLLASGDSAKWPKGFNTASDAMWANNYAEEKKKEMKRSQTLHPKRKGPKI